MKSVRFFLPIRECFPYSLSRMLKAVQSIGENPPDLETWFDMLDWMWTECGRLNLT
jgi:hypothetical protein